MPAAIKPSPETREIVSRMVGGGFKQEDIAAALDLSLKTLRKHYRKEIDTGVTEANNRVAQALFTNATEKNNVTAQIFWLKCRAGWREAQGAPMLPPAPEGWNLTEYSRAELLVIERVQLAAAARATHPAPAADPEGTRRAPSR